MNVAWALVADLEPRGALFEDRGRDLGVVAPPGLLKPKEVETLRAHKNELLAFLRSWPPESADYVQRFGRPEARLYPLINQRVSTLHNGDGVLVSVVAEQAAVVLDNTPGRCAFLPWREIAPLAVKGRTDIAT
ncbi:MAG TPA: hypothetical protein VGG03_10295 [Thermoanaerobaculia bacterium]|jgi:hypothetical protein